MKRGPNVVIELLTAVLLHACQHTTQNQTGFDSSVVRTRGLTLQASSTLALFTRAWSTLASTTRLAHVPCEPGFIEESFKTLMNLNCKEFVAFF
jgi:hypothetical protein